MPDFARFKLTETDHGKGLSAYLKSSLKAGEHQKVAGLINRLQKGNDLTGNPYERFGEKSLGDGDSKIYRNAQSLGYFNGALVVSIREMKADGINQADVLKNLFEAVWSFLPVVGGAGHLTTVQYFDRMADNLNKDLEGKSSPLFSLTTSSNPTTGKPYNGDATLHHDARASIVIDNQG